MATKPQLSKAAQLSKEHAEYLAKLRKEPKVDVYVDEIYAEYIGPKCTFLLNGEPVTLVCDGKPRKYPESVANAIRGYLAGVTSANKKVNKNTKIFG